MSWNKVCPSFSSDAAKRPPYRIEYFWSVWKSFLRVLSRAVRIFLCWSFRDVDNHAGGSFRRLNICHLTLMEIQIWSTSENDS
jgi:hypothetical protein